MSASVLDSGMHRVLVADDEEVIRSVFRAVLEERGDCIVEFARDGIEALQKVSDFRPDVLVTDLDMPRLTGMELTARALGVRPDLTVLVETGKPTIDLAVDLMRRGAVDFVTKPFELDDLRGRLDSALETSLARRTERTVDGLVESFLTALAAKDPYLREHSERVSRYVRHLAADAGIDGKQLEHYAWAGLVHDVGKIGTPELVLHKPGPLTGDEFAEMQRHPVASAEIIRPIANIKGGESTIRAVYHHHERLDGSGYPDGLVGDDIPVGARIVAVCDVYDALASARPYRDAMSEEAIARVLRSSERDRLDRDLVDVFLRNLEGYRSDVMSHR